MDDCNLMLALFLALIGIYVASTAGDIKIGSTLSSSSLSFTNHIKNGIGKRNQQQQQQQIHTNLLAGQCHLSEWKCDNGTCISSSKYCDGQKDCLDGNDEPSSCTGKLIYFDHIV